MTKGWKTIDGKKYYFNRKGQAATSTKYAGYKFDKNGVAKKIKEKKKKKQQKAMRMYRAHAQLATAPRRLQAALPPQVQI